MSVVQPAPQASLEIENRWDDAHAARLSPAELLLYRSNLLGCDKRITNFGGGNTSAKITAEGSADRRRKCEVLWVKGSGGDLGTMKLDGFSTLYMEKFLRAGEASIKGHGQRQRAGAAVLALHLQSESARRQHRHAAARLRRPRACRSHASRCADRHRRLGRFAGADPGNLRRRDRLAAVDSPGLRARPQAAQVHARESRSSRAWCSKRMACSPGATAPRPATRTRSTSSIAPRRGSTRTSARQAAVRCGDDAGAHHRPAPRNRRGHHAARFVA